MVWATIPNNAVGRSEAMKYPKYRALVEYCDMTAVGVGEPARGALEGLGCVVGPQVVRSAAVLDLAGRKVAPYGRGLGAGSVLIVPQARSGSILIRGAGRSQ
jgi:hypothetical protein